MLHTASRGCSRSWLRRLTALIAVSALAFVALPNVAVAANPTEYLDVSFGGTFAEDTYTTGGDEVAKGSVTKHGSIPTKLDGGGITLAGGTNGVTFTPTESFSASGKVNKGFRAEMEYRTTQTPSNLATLFSAMGNIFVRANGSNLEYGFSTNPSGSTWNDYKKSVTLPSNNVKHIIQLTYLPGADGAASTLQLSVDGVAGETATSAAGELAAVSDSVENKFGIGYEVNPASGAASRGLAGDVFRARVADSNAPWEILDASQLLHVDFNGTFSGTSYTAASGEQMLGSLVSRSANPSISNSAVTLGGGTAGFDFTPTDFTLGDNEAITTPLVAELRFTPTQTGDNQTLFGAGGNLFLRYESNKLVFGASTKSGDNWTDHKIESAAATGAEHVVSVAYVPNEAGTGAKLVMRVDGGDAQTKDITGLAYLNSGIKGKVGFGNEVHSAALSRGFVGSLSEIRLAKTSANFTTNEFKLVYSQVSCDTSGIKEANTFDVKPAECEAALKTKLSKLRPTEGQADYIDWGQIGFLHYGINTYYNQEWGHGNEDPSRIDPTGLDTDQWAKSFADGGFKMIMVTVKHHDGFELYDSRYNTEHDWANTAVAKRTGEKDLFRKIVASAKKYGLKVGIYYSPADSYMEKKGVWGNNSARVERTIPTLVENDDRAGKVASGKLPTFKYKATDYGAYMLNQLYELLTEYGDISEVWFDGAQGNTAGTEHYDYGVFYEMIRRLQPQAIQANAAYDARWVGNEDGWARQTEWSPQAAYNDGVDKVSLKPGQMAPDGTLGTMSSVLSEIRSGAANQLHWYPAEVDAKNRPGWFYHANQSPASVAKVVKYYEQSTGRNSQYLLNVPPSDTGKLADADAAGLKGLGEELARRYGTDLALGKSATVAASANGTAVAAPKLTDGSKLSSDKAVGNTPTYTIDLGSAVAVDAVKISEDVRNAGQQIESATLQGRVNGTWTNLATMTTVGQQRDLRFTSQNIDAIRLVVNSSRGPVRLSRLEVFHTESEIQTGARAYYIDPTAQTAGDGFTKDKPMTSIEQLHDVTVAPGSVIFVKAGTELTGDFAVFGYGTKDEPITVTTYGKSDKATTASFDGMTAGLTLKQALKALGKDDAGWVVADSATAPASRVYVPQDEISVHAQSSQNSGAEAAKALDGDSSTNWHSQYSPTAASAPHWVTLDLGESRENVAYFDYLARIDGNNNGAAKDYEVYVSDDPNDFGASVASGTLKNVAYTQRIKLTPKNGRYVKFVIKTDYSGSNFGSAAEMNVELLPTAVEEDKVATPQKPTVDDDADTYTIPDIEGVVYKVDGKVLAAGSVVNVGDENVTVTVTAEPADGYRFPDGVTSPVTYELTFTKKGGEKPPTEVNKDKLHGTITKAQAIDRSAYTDESLKVLDDKLAAALKVYDDDKVSQDDVDAAEAALSAAIDALKTKPTTPGGEGEKPGEGNKPGDGKKPGDVIAKTGASTMGVVFAALAMVAGAVVTLEAKRKSNR